MRLASFVFPVGRRQRRAGRDRRGGSAVEFALTLPIMVMLLLGTIEYGNFFSQHARVVAAARDAARFGANQQSLGLAASRAVFVGATVLADMGFPCEFESSARCTVSAEIVEDGGLSFVEVVIDVEYEQLTGAVPAVGFNVVPTRHTVRASYPVTGVR